MLYTRLLQSPKECPFLNTAFSAPSSECDPCVCEAATQTEECIMEIKAELIEARNCITDLGNYVKIAFFTGFPI